MTVYLTVFWMLALIALLMELNLSKRARLALLSISWLVIVFIVGLRWQTGNDWANYYIFYKHLPSPPEQFAHFEVGFKLFSLFIHNLGMPFAGFNLIYAAIYLGFIFRLCARKCKTPCFCRVLKRGRFRLHIR